MSPKTFLAEDRGVTSIEYGLITALIATAILAALTLMGTSISANFDDLTSAVSGAVLGPQ
jgi:pilus assembly protein Flp/PilA